MKNLLLILIPFTLILNTTKSQEHFKLSDSTFNVGQTYVWGGFNNFDDTFYPRFYERNGERIDSIIDLLNLNDSLIIEVGYHTVTAGSDDFNLSSSKRKSKDFVRVLKQHGLKENIRITSVGYGESQPIISNEELLKIEDYKERYEVNCKLNGRFVIKILDTKPNN